MHRSTTRTTRIAAVLALLFVLVLALTGCGGGDTTEPAAEQPAAQETAFPVTVIDDAAREVTIESEPQRIVSLAPSNTEIVYALGLLDRLVGVTTFDDYPPEVADIERIGDFVQPNIEAITAAQPDLILATTGVQADIVEQLEGTGAVVIAIDPQTLEALFTSIETVGAATGRTEEAGGVVAGMRLELASITDAITATGAEPVRCFLEIAQEPLFTVGEGTLLNDLIIAAGGQSIVTEPGYVAYSLEQLVTDDPDVYLATLGSMSDPSDLGKRPGYDKLSAVVNDRVTVLEDNLVSRPGPRIVEGVRQIAEAMHPAAFE
jgi:iron complex transport system substrate-binding protein